MDTKISQLPQLPNLQGSEDIVVAVNNKNYRVRPDTLGSFVAAGGHLHSIASVTGLQESLDGKAASAHAHGIESVTGLQAALDDKASITVLDSRIQEVIGGVSPVTLDTIKEISDALTADAQVTQVLTDGLATKADINHVHTKADIGLGDADNTSDANKPVSIAVQAALDVKASHSEVDALGLLVADKASSQHTHTKSSVLGLENVDNTSDADKPISILTQGALDTLQSLLNDKAMSNHTHVVSKADVGLGNVDDTSDADKPVSSATQTALDNKANVQYVDSQLVLKANVDDLAAKASATYVDEQLALKADASALADKVSTETLNVAMSSTAPALHAHSTSDINGLEAYIQSRIQDATMPKFTVAESATNDGVDLTITFSRLNAYQLGNLSIKIEHKESSADDSTYVEDSSNPLSNGTYSYTFSIAGVGSGYNLTSRVSLINAQDMNNVLGVKENTITTL